MKTNKTKIIVEQTADSAEEVKKRLESYLERGVKGSVVLMKSDDPQKKWAIKQTSTSTGKVRYLFDIQSSDGKFEKKILMDGKFLSQPWYIPGLDTKYTDEQKFTGQRKTPQQLNVIKTFTDAGWKDIGGILNPAETSLYNTIDLKDDYSTLFPDGYKLVQPIDSVDTNEIINQLNGLTTGKGVNFGDRKRCRNIISKYNVAKQKEAPVNDAVLKIWKNAVNSCAKKVTNFNDLGITKKILGELTADTKNTRWSLSAPEKTTGTNSDSGDATSADVVQENLLIKKIIRENLIELSNNKKKSLVEEYNVINLRFGVITEAGKPKTKKQKEKFVDDIINEIFYLKSQGFNEKLINEQFFDIIKSFFGQVPGGIFDTLKERFAQFVLEKLGLGSEGYLANIFIAAIGNIPIGDYINGKVFDCQYLSNVISKSVGEGIARKIQNEKGMDGYFYDIVRNAMVDMFTESSFGDKIETAIGKMICPGLPKIKEKLNMAGETMKEKAMS